MRPTTFDITSTGFATMLMFALTLTVLCAASSIAKADAALDPTPAAIVKLDDLDLGTAEGARSLYRRIANAAQEVCPQASHGDLNAQAAALSCQRAAIAGGLHQLSPQQLAMLTKVPQLASLR